jgi:ribose transport system ATP-binding protein
MTTSAPLLEARNLTKAFPGVRALKGVDLTLQRGEILAVIGENGGGKSTLMKILAGVLRPDGGEIFIEGEPSGITSVPDALQQGISLIHQELQLADNLDIAANLFLGREKRRFGLSDKARQRREARPLLEAVGLDLDPAILVGTLSIGQQQLVEIAKALSVQARILIMDEPTSSLSTRESEKLFQVIRDLRDHGVGIVYISHRLAEVIDLADRVTVLRDGANAGHLERNEITHEAMVKRMVGRELARDYPHQCNAGGEPMLEAQELRTCAHPEHELTFTVRAGEIVGVSGLIGAGRTALMKTLFGITPAVGGSLRIAGVPVILHSPREAIAAGLALVPEDRKRQGVVLQMAVSENLSLASLRRDQFHGLVGRRHVRDLSHQMITSLRIKTPHSQQPVQFLSGGNQQKVVIGKWLAMHPKVLLLDEPTRGIDIGARQEIYQLMEELASRGVAILFVSSDMEELLGISDRVLVMHEGRLAGVLGRSELNEESVMHLATGRPLAATTGNFPPCN